VLEPGRVWPQAAQRAYSRAARRFSLLGQALERADLQGRAVQRVDCCDSLERWLVQVRRLVRQLAHCDLAVGCSERAQA
jgi:hypothetical protein